MEITITKGDPKLPDGTTIIRRHMSQFVKALPPYFQWKLWLQTERPQYGTVGEADRVEFTCIGCGNKFQRLEMDIIRIGSLVRMPRENTSLDSKGNRTIEQYVSPTPVSSRGLGCAACRALYQEEVQKIERINVDIDRINTLNAKIATFYGTKFDSTPRQTAWLNVEEHLQRWIADQKLIEEARNQPKPQYTIIPD